MVDPVIAVKLYTVCIKSLLMYGCESIAERQEATGPARHIHQINPWAMLTLPPTLVLLRVV